MLETSLLHDGTIAVFSFVDDIEFSQLDWEINKACESVRFESDARALLITSKNDAFLNKPKELKDSIDSCFSRHISEVEIPVIGIVERNAYGVGLELILACDIRVCSVNSKFAMNHIVDGFLPLNGGTQRLPRIVGQGRALDLMLSGREFDSDEAHDSGVVQYVSEISALDDALTLAKTISNYGPIATKYLKEAVKSGVDMSFQQGMKLESDLSVILQSTEDRSEGIHSFLSGNQPRYEGR
jgi:enoyl-CoA hydratase/carnithine racemase